MPGRHKRLGRYVLDVEQDAPDLRDRRYRPSLHRLGKDLFPRAALERLRVRDQGEEGSCAGQALASLIDFLRVDASPPGQVAPSSARMLIELARRVERRDNRSPEQGVNGLRSVVKAFYHNGVCLDEHWPYEPRKPRGPGAYDDRLTPGRSKHARKLAPGAYFRLDPVLNDYHAALNEAGAVLVAAHVHDGWRPAAIEGGRIAPGDASAGGHAFVLVGYDDKGFLVLNSWGEGWGGYDGVPGVAHWSYADWAESVLDGWVLRLAVSTPEAFHLGVGLQGFAAGLNVPVAGTSTPRIELVGHYVHLDDGVHVEVGQYPSSRESLAETVGLLQDRAARGEAEHKYEHVLLWLAGANETTKDAVADAARLKRMWLAHGVYPVTVFWCSDFVEEVVAVLDGVFRKAEARVGRTGPDLDRVIEAEVRGAGRAFLRDIKRRSAVAATRPDGDMVDALRRLGPLAPRHRLHLVAEGVGAIMAADLAACPGAPLAPGLPGFETLTLLSPALTERRFGEVLDALPPRDGPRVTVVTPDPATERRMRVGPYGGSMLRLVDRAFEEGPETDALIGLRGVARRARARLGGPDGRVGFEEVAAPPAVASPKMHHVTRGPDAVELLARCIGADARSAAKAGGPRSRHAAAL